MKTFNVFFEAFGKKLKTTVNANNEDEAKLEIFKKVRFIKFEETRGSDEDAIYEFLRDFFNK
jgi:hypothetical protein